MSDTAQEKPALCPCGAKLWSREELLAADDEVLQHVGEAYVDDESGYCLEEDDVVPYSWIVDHDPDPADWSNPASYLY